MISLSRVVELTNNGDSQLGVLLVDMDYSNISRMMKQINTLNNGQYYYLCDSNGEIIYHMRQIQISDGIGSENSKALQSTRMVSMMRHFRESAARLLSTPSAIPDGSWWG